MTEQRAIATIGVFDGVHRGHQFLLTRAVARAESFACQSAAVTFDPPPAKVLHPDTQLKEITVRDEKVRLLAASGVDRVLVIHFSEKTARLEARDFVTKILLPELPLAGVIVGYDFRFGRGAAGDAQLLTEVGREHGFWVEQMPAILWDGLPISSTRVREALARGAVSEASELLGHPFSVEGVVVSGKGLGRRALVPTANLEIAREQLLPAQGVYLVEVRRESGIWGGVAMVGSSPTMGGSSGMIEVHLLRFSGGLLGERIGIVFLEWMRTAKRFDDLDALRQAINADLTQAEGRFAALALRYASRPAGDLGRGSTRGPAQNAASRGRMALPPGCRAV